MKITAWSRAAKWAFLLAAEITLTGLAANYVAWAKSLLPAPAPTALPCAAPSPNQVPNFHFSEGTAAIETPNVFSVEFFGRGLVYSLDYDREISDRVALGLGISYWDIENWWQDTHAAVLVVPVYANYYFSPGESRGFLSAGIDAIWVNNPVVSRNTFDRSGAAVTVGGGYEHRASNGFLFRVAGYLIAGRSPTISPSFSLGLAF